MEGDRIQEWRVGEGAGLKEGVGLMEGWRVKRITWKGAGLREGGGAYTRGRGLVKAVGAVKPRPLSQPTLGRLQPMRRKGEGKCDERGR